MNELEQAVSAWAQAKLRESEFISPRIHDKERAAQLWRDVLDAEVKLMRMGTRLAGAAHD